MQPARSERHPSPAPGAAPTSRHRHGATWDPEPSWGTRGFHSWLVTDVFKGAERECASWLSGHFHTKVRAETRSRDHGLAALNSAQDGSAHPRQLLTAAADRHRALRIETILTPPFPRAPSRRTQCELASPRDGRRRRRGRHHVSCRALAPPREPRINRLSPRASRPPEFI